MREHYRNLTPLAREMRKEPTPAEKKLWFNYLRNCPWKFQRQKPIRQYIADFYCAKLNLVIEVDGGYHNEKEQRELDEVRSVLINELGITVIRFTNEEIDRDFPNVCGKIINTAKSLQWDGGSPSVSSAR